MNRRAFLQLATAAAAGLVLDPERLLWVPGKKTIFLPTLRRPTTTEVWASACDQLRKGDIFTIEGCYSRSPITREQTMHLQQFVVLSDVTSDQATIEIQPADISPRVPEKLGKRRARPLYSAPLDARDRGWSHKRV